MKRWSTLCLSILQVAALTACGRTQNAAAAWNWMPCGMFGCGTYGIRKGEDPGNIGITFRNCSFRDDPEAGATGDWSCAVFEDCDFSTPPADSFSEK